MKALVSLTVIGALCAILLAGTHAFTSDAIQANRTTHAWRIAFDLTGGAFPTLDLHWDADQVLLPNGFVLRRATVNGYAGAVEMLAAFQPGADGTRELAGVRITRHRETPGLGDFIDTAKSPWIHQFAERPPEQVDAVTGATITSEAVQRGVLALLQPAEPRLPVDGFRSQDGRSPLPAGDEPGPRPRPGARAPGPARHYAAPPPPLQPGAGS